MNRLTNADAYIQALDGSGNPTTTVASTVRYNGHEGYSYDRIGNITTLLRDTIGAIGDWVIAYNYVAGTNKLASVSRPTGASTFGYDLAGNMVNDQYQDINTIQYGRANLPFQLLIGMNATDKYDYNADDQRVYKQSIDYSLTDPDGELDFSYYLNDVGIMHVDSSWTMYVNGRNRLMEFNYTPVRVFSGGQDFVPLDVAADTVVPFFYKLYDSLNWVQEFEEFYVYDHLGNTRVLYHPGLNVTEGVTSILDTLHNVLDYFPYGKILREYKYANEERYLMTYQERDAETGYDNKGARWYNSDVPHFMSLDPKAMTFVCWSPYNYVMGNPVKFVDPDGRGVFDVLKGIGEGAWSDAKALGNAVIHPQDAAQGLFQAATHPLQTAKAIVTNIQNGVNGTDEEFGQALWQFNTIFIPGGEGEAKAGLEASKIAEDVKVVEQVTSTTEKASEAATTGSEIVIDPENKIPRDQLNPPIRAGNAPTFIKDDTKVEIHHEGQNPEGPFKEMHKNDHREGENYKKNHPNSAEPTKINRGEFNKMKQAYWKKEYPKSK